MKDTKHLCDCANWQLLIDIQGIKQYNIHSSLMSIYFLSGSYGKNLSNLFWDKTVTCHYKAFVIITIKLYSKGKCLRDGYLSELD